MITLAVPPMLAALLMEVIVIVATTASEMPTIKTTNRPPTKVSRTANETVGRGCGTGDAVPTPSNNSAQSGTTADGLLVAVLMAVVAVLMLVIVIAIVIVRAIAIVTIMS